MGAGHINLSWIASSDNVGVQKYFVERCQGAGCTDFAYVATAGGTAFGDGDVATSSSYSYRVRAADAQGNLSPYSNTASAATSEPPVPGLVAAYSFNEGSGTTVSDASGNGNHGAIVGTAGWASQGVFGGALGFDGATLVQVPAARMLNLTTAMTLQAWVRPSATGFWRDVIYKGNDNYFLEGSSDTNTPAAGGTWAGGNQYVSAPAELSLNTWTHLAASYDGSAVRLYVNGAQVASFAVSGALVSSSHPLQIGGDSVFGQFFNGLIDEVRVYNRALSQAEIQAAMNAPLGDISAPTAPSALTATAAGGTQINLAWTASTDNVGVTGYRVERCQGAGCGSFAQIGTPTGTTFGDTGLTAGTSYSYRVRAADAAGNLSAYSNVASATTATGQAQMYLIYSDHLNTPRLIADQQGTTVWRWDQGEPFGNDVPNSNPSGAGTFEFNLRFPGQYFDRETNLAYNYFRDYDPAIGRYVKSDPIGLGGGMNTYVYVWQSPVKYSDFFGLDECWWLDLGNAEKCDPTGLRRQKPTQEYATKEWFPAPDPTSPSLGFGPIPPMPEPGMKLVWRTVFKEKGYWEAEFECKVFAAYICKDACGKITSTLGNKPLGKKWEKEANSDYDEITGYGRWSDVTAPPGPWDLH